jgi:hypothetical protein
LPCISIAGLDDLIDFLAIKANNQDQEEEIDGIDIGAIERYREQYGC